MGDLASNAELDAIYLVELTVQQPGGATTSGDPDLGARAFGDGIELDDIAAGTLVLRYADQEYATLPSDAPASEIYQPRVTLALSINRSVPLSPGDDGRGGIVALQAGEIEIDNSDGELDAIIDSYSIDGRDVTIKRVQRGAAYATAVTVFKGTSAGWSYGDRSRVKLALLGVALLLDRPVQDNVYAGTGDKEGGTDLIGLRKPVNYGWTPRYTPPCNDTVRLIYQLNDGPIDGGVVVRDGDAASYTFNADFATYALLKANATPAGKYDTCLAEGFVKLGTKPNFNLTVDFRGDKSPPAGGGAGVYRTTTADIGQHIIEARMGLAGLPIAADFAALAALQPAEVGISLGTDLRLGSEVLGSFFNGIGARLADTVTGRVTCFRIDAPAAAPADQIPAEVIADPGIESLALPDEVNPCLWRAAMAYQRNWTVQTSNLAASVLADIDRVALVGKPYQVASQIGAGVKLSNPNAKDHAVIEAYFRYKADADAELVRLLALFAPGRRALGVPLKSVGLETDLGQSLRLFYDRFRLNDGPSVLVFEQTFGSSGKDLRLAVFK